jgi:type II secretory pathway pseudopilin PulG
MKTQTTQVRSIRKRSGQPVGFTLIEVLISITIIIALAVVVVMITSRIKDKANQANAMSSLRQVSSFNVAYSTENNGDINTMRWVGDPKEGGGGSWVSNSFWGRLQPYFFPDIAEKNQPKLKNEINLRLDQLFGTTDADKMAGTFLSGAKIYHDGSGLAVPFAFNQNLHTWGRFIKVSSVSDPSMVIYATYGFGFFNKQDGDSYEPIPKTNSVPNNNIYYLDSRKAMATFLDGRVELVSPPIPDRNLE